ncbi:tyrosine-type recombinase/integrase [Streptomyces buecherae]|uniref:tyrosine-type recombinase/integrase n=1 Tax=Streptomyces buecherae TaxID=2763006 RepID=UPI0033F6D802
MEARLGRSQCRRAYETAAYPRSSTHTHASWLIAGKVPLPVIQARLGHESITTTVDRYGHLLESSDDEVVAAVQWAMGAAAAKRDFSEAA